MRFVHQCHCVFFVHGTFTTGKPNFRILTGKIPIGNAVVVSKGFFKPVYVGVFQQSPSVGGILNGCRTSPNASGIDQ